MFHNFSPSSVAITPSDAHGRSHRNIVSNTYCIVENIHELLEALRFPESDADFLVCGKDLQRLQREMLNDREV